VDGLLDGEFGMDMIGWLMLGVGVMFLGFGLVAVVGLVGSLTRQEGQGPLVFGVGVVLTALSRVSSLPGEVWLTWAGIACVLAAVVLTWRSYRRRPRTGHPTQ
jgi:hypothetical protein